MLLIEGLPLFYAPAIVSALVTKNNQRLGDLAAGTLVVREAKAPRPQYQRPPIIPPIPPERYASWDVTAIGDNESVAVRAFLERRQQLDPGARAAIAAQLAGRLRSARRRRAARFARRGVPRTPRRGEGPGHNRRPPLVDRARTVRSDS